MATLPEYKNVSRSKLRFRLKLADMKLFVLRVVALLVFTILRISNARADQTTADHFAKAREHFQKGRYGEAIEVLDKMVEGRPVDLDPVRLALMRCDALLAQGEREIAELIIREELKTHDESPLLHAQLAKMHFDRGRYSDVEASVAKALSLDPENKNVAQKINGQKTKGDAAPRS